MSTANAVPLINLIVQGGCLFNKLYQFALHIDHLGGALQEYMVLASQVVQLEEDVGLARVGGNQFAQLCHHLVVQQVGSHRDGDAVDGTFLDGLKELHARNAEVFGTIGII